MLKALKKSLSTPDSYVSLALGFAVVLVIGMITFNYFKAKTAPAGQTAEQQKDQIVQTALPTKHTVKQGETLWAIAQTYFKSGYNWVDIARANNLSNPDRIMAGAVLTIPDVKPIALPTGVVSSATTEKRQYTVKAGDSLWKIAVAQYDNGYRWSEIARLNTLANPDLIHAGNILELP